MFPMGFSTACPQWRRSHFCQLPLQFFKVMTCKKKKTKKNFFASHNHNPISWLSNGKTKNQENTSAIKIRIETWWCVCVLDRSLNICCNQGNFWWHTGHTFKCEHLSQCWNFSIETFFKIIVKWSVKRHYKDGCLACSEGWVIQGCSKGGLKGV